MMAPKDRASVGRTKTKQVQRLLNTSAGFPVGSATIDGREVLGGVVTANVLLPIKHPSKDSYRWPSNPHLESLIQAGIVTASDAPIMSDVDAADPEWANATEDALTD